VVRRPFIWVRHIWFGFIEEPMRYLTVVLSPKGGTFHPVEEIIADTDELERGRVYQLNLLSDSSVVGLYGVEGNAEVLREVIEETQQIVTYEVFETDDENHMYVHLEPGEPLVELLSIADDYRLILDTPIEFESGEGRARATVMGEQEVLRDALESVPDDIDVSIEQVGEYQPERNNILSQLTERQKEVLRVAVEEGYYDVPRSATHDEIADALGCAPSTASEHLRKIESKITEELVG